MQHFDRELMLKFTDEGRWRGGMKDDQLTDNSGAIVRETFAKFDKSDGVNGERNLVCNSAEGMKLFLGRVLSLDILIVVVISIDGARSSSRLLLARNNRRWNNLESLWVSSHVHDLSS